MKNLIALISVLLSTATFANQQQNVLALNQFVGKTQFNYTPDGSTDVINCPTPASPIAPSDNGNLVCTVSHNGGAAVAINITWQANTDNLGVYTAIGASQSVTFTQTGHDTYAIIDVDNPGNRAPILQPNNVIYPSLGQGHTITNAPTYVDGVINIPFSVVGGKYLWSVFTQNTNNTFNLKDWGYVQ